MSVCCGGNTQDTQPRKKYTGISPPTQREAGGGSGRSQEPVLVAEGGSRLGVSGEADDAGGWVYDQYWQVRRSELFLFELACLVVWVWLAGRGSP